ncbi:MULTISPECIES: STAS domain-containing protein [Shewanella]|uniref:Anti-sigma factor antagonist n=1 Tax=Shewanella psychromarinicola TaxID=2487742 RepID=A0A3N4E2X1_9GAMM|nr:STAS domain-containing protein [Shewanella psychromarinicola]AZG35413.1 anti-sigma factor antagonist [Shewanella psychromarinicola]MCL1084222.1 STAS domain-containing protein [Shewanella psychromarinicola]RPA31148.1 anti-sigma factor antagonist [Shewanella psychromarinicola]
MLTFAQTEKGCIARIEGPMTINNAMELKNQFISALRASQDLELDLAAVTDIDTAGLQLLIMAKQQQIFVQHNLTLIHHSKTVFEAFEILGLVSWFNDPIVITRQ